MWYNHGHINEYTPVCVKEILQNMSFKNPLLFSVTMLLCAGNTAHAGAHPNPLDILNGVNRDKSAVPTSRKRVRGHHASPLDVIRGRHVKNKTPRSKTKKVIYLEVKPSDAHQKSTRSTPKVSPHITVTDVVAPASSDTAPRSSTQALEASTRLSAVDMLGRRKKQEKEQKLTPLSKPIQEAPLMVEGMTLPSPSTEAKTTQPTEAQQEASHPIPAKVTVPSVAIDNSELPTGKRLKKLLTITEKLTPSAMEKAYHAAKEKTLYLTFDDGPIGGTANLLRVLKEEDVKATMFCIGREVVNHSKLFHQELAMPNLLVANHTYTHANNHYRRFYNSPAAHVVADIDKAQHAIGGAKYLRLCGRNVWRLPTVKRDDWGISVAQRGREIPKYNALWDHGYFTYGWDVEWLFSHKTQRPLFNGEEMARRVNLRYQGTHTAKRGKVVLLAHDFMFRSAYNTQQLRTFIQIMKAQGWTFETIDDYSRETPGAYVHTEKKTPAGKLRPAQKVARKAKILVPDNKPEVVKGSGKVIGLMAQLGQAVRNQSFIDVRRLLARGANINGRTPEGEIPLSIAIGTNNAVLVRMLVERGARILNLDANGMSPMGIAREHHNTIIIRYLTRQIAKQKQRRLYKTVFSLEG